MDSANLTQFSIFTAVTSLYHAYQSSLNPLNILLELYSSNPPMGPHNFLRARAGFSCQWELISPGRGFSPFQSPLSHHFITKKIKKPKIFACPQPLLHFRNLCLHPTVEIPPLHMLLILINTQYLKITQKCYQFKST